MKFDLRKDLKTLFVIAFAAVMMAVNIKTFVRAGGLYPGGVNGLTILIQRIVEMVFGYTPPFTVINFVLNAVPVYIGFKYIGKKFTAYSILMIILTSVLTDLVPGFAVTEDTLLISIFGGIINGTAISLCLLSGATSGGTDFISIFLSERKGVDTFNVILGFNALILIAAGALFGWDKAMYSIIFQFASTVVIRALYLKFQQSTLFVVTMKPQEVSAKIYEVSNHGATIINGEGSFGHSEKHIVYSVIARADSREVVKAIKETDPEAFINVLRTDKLSGYFYYKKED
ncbi:MAG: YitT family protein [Clostridiales bacterium]|nr:YitT family protein [Clostridiales bacterium]